MATFSLSLPVETSPAQLWKLVGDVQRVAALFQYVSIDDFTSPSPGCWVFRRTLRVPTMEALSWREEARAVGGRELHFRALEGDLATFAGCWRVTPEGGYAGLHLELEYEIPAGRAPSMPASLLTYVMNELFTTICTRVKEVAEGAPV